WLQIPPGDIESRRCRYDDTCAHRKHTAVVRTPARRIRTAITVGRLCQTALPWRFKKCPPSFTMHLDAEKLRERLEPLFRENFDKRGELGAAVSVWQNGKPIVDLYGGFCDA